MGCSERQINTDSFWGQGSFEEHQCCSEFLGETERNYDIWLGAL